MNVKCRNIIRIYDKKGENGLREARVESTVEMNDSYVTIIFDKYEVEKRYSDMCKFTFFMNNEIVAIVVIERDKIYNGNYERLVINDKEQFMRLRLREKSW